MGHMMAFTTDINVPLSAVLDIVTSLVYDKMHGFGPTEWVVDAESLLSSLAESAGVSDDEIGRMFDEARVRVHGVTETAGVVDDERVQ